jgi:hypothetical protein
MVTRVEQLSKRSAKGLKGTCGYFGIDTTGMNRTDMAQALADHEKAHPKTQHGGWTYQVINAKINSYK